METPKHDSADRLKIASVTGALSYLAGRVKQHGMTIAEGAAELRAITADPHLLSHGLASRSRDEVVVALAVAAGASAEEADAIHAEMHPPGRRGMRLGRGEVA